MARGSKESQTSNEMNVKTTPIAIIGIGSVFPQAHSTQEYWDNILRKIDCVTEVPPSRWSIEDYYDPDPSVPDKTYCKRGGFIPDIDFDPMEFGLPPNILEVTDVSQLLSLVVARDALEDAGYGENRVFDRDHTGVILGVVGMSSKLFTPLMTRLQYPVWEKVLLNAGVSAEDTHKITEKIKLAYVNWEENSFPGAIGNVVAGRICNRFDLGGTNCVVDAACASSLAALKMALGELIEGRANMMITGGVDTDNTINTFMCFSKTPAFSKGEHVRTFDAESDGMMVGEGLGMLVLKRLEDAERDGDRIYAVIKAIGTSSDGRYKSIYAPRSSGQAKALRRAYAEAGFSPATVGLVEAHGTGTMAGDPSEFQGMVEIFGEDNPRRQYIALGSVKSQIAHTKAAAGAASLIKTALALHHKILPATINVNRPNPKFDIENTPFYLNTETRPWIRAKNSPPRRAGVSSFGFGGTNYHVVLEEYQPDHQGAYRVNAVARPVLLDAATPAELLTTCREALQKLQGETAVLGFKHLVEVGRERGIAEHHARVGFVAASVDEARQALQICVDSLAAKPQEESWENPKGIYYRKTGMALQGKVVALFSGQGSQYLEMGRELALNFPVVREVFGAMDEIFLKDGLEPLSARVYPRPVFDAKAREELAQALTRTEHAQPAIGAISVGLYKLLQQAGFQPDFVAGHSFGELTALWAAGVLSDVDYYSLAKARGKAMAPPADSHFDAGTMVAVKGEWEKVRDALQGDAEVTLANWNSNDQVVIAGSKPAMERAQKVLNEQGFKTIPLTVSAAFHTPLVGHAQKPFAKAIKAAQFQAPRVPVYSNSTAQPHAGDPEAIRTLLAGHILKPVLFRDEIENIYAAGGRVFVEFGPKNVLTNLVDNILAGKPHLAISLNANAKKDSDRQLREAVMALCVAGLALQAFDPYAMELKAAPPRKKSPVTVKLNGGYYRSEKSRAAFENALQDGFRITLPVHAAAAPASMTVKDAAVPPAPPAENKAQPAHLPVEDQASMKPMTASSFEHVLAEYQGHQSETLRLHEQYLRTEEEYARAFAQLTQLQAELVRKGNAGELQSVLPLFESLERSMTRFHEHQAETLRIHQRYLETQERFSQTLVQGLGNGPLVSGALESGAQNGKSVAAPLSAAVSYEAPTPPARPQATGQSIPVVAVAPKNGANGHSTPAGVAPAPVQPAVVAPPAAPVQPAPTAPAGSLDREQLIAALLQIVSEKTGYPVETLELDMDMEADLGIDSIKRVEILGAMQTQFPELPKLEAAVLAEQRTLGQIADQFGASALAARPATAAVQTAVETATLQAVVPPSAASVDPAVITQALLQVVSEKTGYPVETLELDMDMEADLGIDSIKRVEILGAIQSQFPELPRVEANVLAELRTLGQITQSLSAVSAPAAVAGMAAESPAQALPAETKPAPAAHPGVETITAALLQIVSEKTGYPVETLELDMDMEADLGIDSIKRVEILGAMQAQFPELPKIDAAALAELRTLGQIIASMSSLQTAQDAGAPSQEGTAASPFDFGSAEPEFVPYGIEQGVVIRKILPEPDRLEWTLPARHVCLITDDGTPVTPALAQGMLDQNWPVVVLRLPSEILPTRQPLPEKALSVELADLSETALQGCLDQIAASYGPVAVFVYQAIHAQTPGDGIQFSQAQKALVKLVFLIAKHLKVSLNQAAAKGRAAFMTVTHLDGEFGLSERAGFTPVEGGLFGLVKTLNLEWEAVFCRAVDLSPTLETEQVVRNILAELSDPNRLITEVGYNGKERSTLALAAVPATGGKK